MKNIFKNKLVLVAGGTGMVGIPLTKKLCELGSIVHVALDTHPLSKDHMLKNFIN